MRPHIFLPLPHRLADKLTEGIYRLWVEASFPRALKDSGLRSSLCLVLLFLDVNYEEFITIRQGKSQLIVNFLSSSFLSDFQFSGVLLPLDNTGLMLALLKIQAILCPPLLLGTRSAVPTCITGSWAWMTTGVCCLVPQAGSDC